MWTIVFTRFISLSKVYSAYLRVELHFASHNHAKSFLLYLYLFAWMRKENYNQSSSAYLYISAHCCWHPAWTSCCANLASKGTNLDSISAGGLYTAASAVSWLSDCAPPGGCFPPSDRDSADGRSVLGRQSKRRSGSIGLLDHLRGRTMQELDDVKTKIAI